jgi:hypothetical protein
MGDRRIFLKTYAPPALIKALRMNLISARSISLDSTFKQKKKTLEGKQWKGKRKPEEMRGTKNSNQTICC